MKLKDWLNWALPKPKVPQKRYLAVIGLALYFAAKVYVSSTPSPHDDRYLDNVRDAVVTIFANAENEPDPSDEYDKEGLRFGEGYN